MFATPKSHILVQNREFWRILHQNQFRVLGCSELQEPPKKTNTFWVCNLARKVTHARKGNPWVNRDELLHRCRGPRRNHLCQFLWFLHTGFERGAGSNFGLLHWLASSPLQHSHTTVRVCDIYMYIYVVALKSVQLGSATCISKNAAITLIISKFVKRHVCLQKAAEALVRYWSYPLSCITATVCPETDHWFHWLTDFI